MESVALGPFDYGTDGNGTWTAATTTVFNALLGSGYNGTATTVLPSQYLCTMSLNPNDGDPTACTQKQTSTMKPPPPPGAGLENLDDKLIYFAEGLFNDRYGNQFICFLDASTPSSLIGGGGYPMCGQSRFDNVQSFNGSRSICPSPEDPDNFGPSLTTVEQLDSRAVAGISEYYNLEYCIKNVVFPGRWLQLPGYLWLGSDGTQGRYKSSLRWPALELATLTCDNGLSAADTSNENAARVPTLCGDDFDAWFDTRVPPVPPQLTAVADTTLDRSDPHDNDGANPRLMLVGNKHRAVIGFDPDQLQTFLDENALESARLVLSGADRSSGGGDIWLQASPLDATFVEGNGNRREGDRGSGSGATYACAEDAEIADFAEDCLQDWPPRFDRRGGDRVEVPDGHTGKVIFDVTADVEDGVSAWLVKRVRGGRSTAVHSREGAEQQDDLSLAPTLILIPKLDDEVAEAK